MIKALIFDVGGVILDLSKKRTMSIPYAFSVLFDMPVEEAQTLWNKHRENLLTGKETPRAVLKKIKKKYKLEKSVDTLYLEWEQTHAKKHEHINWELLAYIESLKNKYKVYVLSDTIDLGHEDELTRDIASKFDGYYLSHKEGLRKPYKEAFINILNKTGFKSEECVFVDDIEKNVKSANSLGITSFIYTDLETLKKDFLRANIV